MLNRGFASLLFVVEKYIHIYVTTVKFFRILCFDADGLFSN